MLIISGTAECITPSEQYNVGNIHSLMMFTTDEVLENNLASIEKNLNNLGWDEINIEDAEVVSDVSDLNHQVLIEGYKKAKQEGLAFVVSVDSVEEVVAA